MALLYLTLRRGLMAAILAASLAPGSALAHAMMHASDPADGTTLTTSPRTVNLTFTEPCRVTAMRLLDNSGREQQLRREGARGNATTSSATVPSPLPPGAYRVEWRAMGDDGHVMSGTVRFVVASTR